MHHVSCGKQLLKMISLMVENLASKLNPSCDGLVFCNDSSVMSYCLFVLVPLDWSNDLCLLSGVGLQWCVDVYSGAQVRSWQPRSLPSEL